MILKMIKSSAVTSALVVLGCTSIVGCGEDAKDKAEETDAGATGGGNDGPYDVSFTLVPVLAVDTSAPIATPHKVQALNSLTGAPLNPPVETMTEAGTGKFTLKGLPSDTPVAIYVVGVGPVSENSSTYDTMLLNLNPLAGDPLFRISSVGTFMLGASTGGYTALDDRASLSGAVYWSPGGKRKGAVGCATICIDGKSADPDFALRYVASSGLPTTLDMQTQTISSGRFLVGNLTEGSHKISASLDDCKTIIGKEVEFFVPFSRAEAMSPLKSVLLQLPLDIDTAENPTPKSCAAD